MIDPKQHNPDPAYVRRLVDRIGLPQTSLAGLLKIDRRTFRRYLQDSGVGASPMPYVVQIALEGLARGQLKHGVKSPA